MKEACAVVAMVLLVTFGISQECGASLIHRYELNGSYNDALGGDSLTPGGPSGLGTLTSTYYLFDPGEGLSLSGALPHAGTYSILIDFSFSTLTGYRKILDFVNLTSDNGLYDFSTSLAFYPTITGPAGAFRPEVSSRLIVTRDSSTNEFTSYINGRKTIDFVDSSKLAVFNAPSTVIQFFNDDRVTAGEISAGAVDRIEIYDTALTPAEAAAMGAPNVPEQGTIGLIGAGLFALLRGERRRRNGSRSAGK